MNIQEQDFGISTKKEKTPRLPSKGKSVIVFGALPEEKIILRKHYPYVQFSFSDDISIENIHLLTAFNDEASMVLLAWPGEKYFSQIAGFLMALARPYMVYRSTQELCEDTFEERFYSTI